MSVVRVYNTEANARSGGNTGLISDAGGDGVHDDLVFGGATFKAGVYNSTNALPYCIFERYYYRIESNEPVLEFHIDWDDGEDNSRKKRNLQIVKFNDPVNFCVVDHIYTSAGLKFPMFRVKSIDGFLSKWYIHDKHTAALNPSLTPYLDEVNNSVTLSTGQNDFSKVSLDKTDTGGIPVFSPQNVPPVCILKADKKRMFAGIANNILQQNFESGTQYTVLYAFSDVDMSTFTGNQPKIKLTVETDDKHINEYVIHPNSVVTTNTTWSRNTSSDTLGNMTVPFGNYNRTNGGGTHEARRLLRAEIIDTNDFPDDARIYIHAVNIGESYTLSNLNEFADENRTVCVLSNGNPIVDSSDPMFSANVDASESYNRSSDHGIQTYYIDDDTMGDYNSRGSKVYTSNEWRYPNTDKSVQDPSTSNGDVAALRHPTDVLKGTELDMYNRGTNPTLNVAYTHGSHGHRKDEDGRFLSFYRLIRGQVRGTDSVSQDDELPEGNFSRIAHYKRNLYTSTADSGVVRLPSQYGSEGLIMLSNSDTYTNNNQFDAISGTPLTGISDGTWSNLSTAAGSTDHMITSYSTFGANSNGDNVLKLQDGGTTTVNNNTYTQVPNNYLLICQTDKFDRIHFRTNNYNLVRAVVGESNQHYDNNADITSNIQDINFTGWYMGPSGWKPLELIDRTNGFSNSGSISFKRPADWTLQTKSGWGTNGPVNPNDGSNVDKSGTYASSGTTITVTINSHGYSQNQVLTVDFTSGTQIDGTTYSVNSVIDGNTFTIVRTGGNASKNTNGNVSTRIFDGSTDVVDPDTLWDFNAYAVLIGMHVNANTDLKTQITSIWPFSNEHSQYIKVIDPHHVSLNSIAIAQSISFNRTGKFQNITDRFGKTEIRKIGVNGGKVTFGSVDLGDTDEQGNRKKIKRYQQNATPVYLDVTHKSGEKTRFFGVITQMSEDHPTGNQNPKYAVTMQVSHLIEYNSSGTLLSDKISIGGNSDGTRKYFTSA